MAHLEISRASHKIFPADIINQAIELYSITYQLDISAQ